MAGYSELIKNFEKIRDFTRDFLIYGFKTRNDYTRLSPRSYDNERRRIESYLSELIAKNQDSRGKTISISSNTTAKSSNPLFKVWQTKSFTKNDCFLHFVILDILSTHERLNVTEIAEIISENYITESNNEDPIDLMTIRNKLNEYTKLGILEAAKHGKTLYYALAPNPLLKINPETRENLDLALSFYKNILPAGFLGHSINNTQDSPFIYRQIFFSQILDDDILLRILSAINNKQAVTATMASSTRNMNRETNFLPLKILVNTKTGRRYIAIYSLRNKKFSTIRLDYVKEAAHGAVYSDYDNVCADYLLRIKNSFSITHQSSEQLNHVKMLLSIDEATEQFMLERIRREGKHGTVAKIDTNLFEYSIDVADTLEMVPWLRTFIGRIVKLEGTENHVISQFKRDINSMASLYSETNID
ncbi:MAG: hypothetical protein K0S75_1865 [Clostridia bacterium]|jgi:DNA-binding transcriptional ArsR family regulator|nr:hypothetical protein [Clostridia bacterium]